MLLSNKNIIITGAGRGIGASVAIACASEGANVGLMARTIDELESIKKKIDALGKNVKVVVKAADITNYNEVEAAFKEFNSTLGSFHGVIANAGQSFKAATHECDPARFKNVLDVNVAGVFHAFKAAYPFLAKEDKKSKAKFLITGSAAYPNGMGKFAAYTASKFAIVGLQRALALEYSSENITFNSIMPTMVDTRLLRGSKAGDGNKPPTVMNPEDVNEYFVFMMSDLANRISDELLDTNDFEQVRVLIKDAPAEKKQDWELFKVYLEEKLPAVYKGLKKLKALAEYLVMK